MPTARTTVRLPWPLTVMAVGALAATALGACGSSGTSSSVLGSQLEQSCTAVADVLSDGPDPGADPVGYAEAQVLPLRQLKISQPGLRRAVSKLASAYQAYADSNGTSVAPAKASVSSAEKAVNRICPGAAQ